MLRYFSKNGNIINKHCFSKIKAAKHTHVPQIQMRYKIISKHNIYKNLTKHLRSVDDGYVLYKPANSHSKSKCHWFTCFSSTFNRMFFVLAKFISILLHSNVGFVYEHKKYCYNTTSNDDYSYNNSMCCTH
jgi:hypothetical protein